MKKYEIKYQKGFNIYIDNIDATNKSEAVYFFYINNRNADILDIEEVNKIGNN